MTYQHICFYRCVALKAHPKIADSAITLNMVFFWLGCYNRVVWVVPVAKAKKK
jgi:hypothetical protein